MKLEFDPIADAAYFEISTAEVVTSKEIETGIIIDYDEYGHIVGIEVLSMGKRSQKGLNLSKFKVDIVSRRAIK
jgi:uncharacterized protein YuzE